MLNIFKKHKKYKSLKKYILNETDINYYTINLSSYEKHLFINNQYKTDDLILLFFKKYFIIFFKYLFGQYKFEKLPRIFQDYVVFKETYSIKKCELVDLSPVRYESHERKLIKNTKFNIISYESESETNIEGLVEVLNKNNETFKDSKELFNKKETVSFNLNEFDKSNNRLHEKSTKSKIYNLDNSNIKKIEENNIFYDNVKKLKLDGNTESFQNQSSFMGYTLNKVQKKVLNTALYSSDNFLVCAPTGIGKTLIGMMVIQRQIELKNTKICYIAPMKALVSEIYNKLKIHFNLKIYKATSDLHLSKISLIDFDILVGTPEKIEILLRNNLVLKFNVIIIDEIHILNEPRGSLIEGIVINCISRNFNSKTNGIFRNFSDNDNKKQNLKYEDDFVNICGDIKNNGLDNNYFNKIRLVGLSATCYNYIDIGEFLKCSVNNIFYFDDSCRPVPIKYKIIRSLNYHTTLLDIINRHPNKNFLIFTHSIKETQEYFDYLKSFTKLKVSVHHSKINKEERHKIEDEYRNGKFNIMVSTSTLSYGVNLPVDVVVVIGTKYFTNNENKNEDIRNKNLQYINNMTLRQMIGRGGRNNQDCSYGYIISDEDRDSFYYEETIESNLLFNIHSIVLNILYNNKIFNEINYKELLDSELKNIELNRSKFSKCTNNLNTQSEHKKSFNIIENLQNIENKNFDQTNFKNYSNYSSEKFDMINNVCFFKLNNSLTLKNLFDIFTNTYFYIRLKKINKNHFRYTLNILFTVIYDLQKAGMIWNYKIQHLGKISNKYFISYKKVSQVSKCMKTVMSEMDSLRFIISLCDEMEINENNISKKLNFNKTNNSFKNKLKVELCETKKIITESSIKFLIDYINEEIESLYLDDNLSRILKCLLEISLYKKYFISKFLFKLYCKVNNKNLIFTDKYLEKYLRLIFKDDKLIHKEIIFFDKNKKVNEKKINFLNNSISQNSSNDEILKNINSLEYMINYYTGKVTQKYIFFTKTKSYSYFTDYYEKANDVLLNVSNNSRLVVDDKKLQEYLLLKFKYVQYNFNFLNINNKNLDDNEKSNVNKKSKLNYKILCTYPHIGILKIRLYDGMKINDMLKYIFNKYLYEETDESYENFNGCENGINYILFYNWMYKTNNFDEKNLFYFENSKMDTKKDHYFNNNFEIMIKKLIKYLNLIIKKLSKKKYIKSIINTIFLIQKINNKKMETNENKIKSGSKNIYNDKIEVFRKENIVNVKGNCKFYIFNCNNIFFLKCKNEGSIKISEGNWYVMNDKQKGFVLI